jgi:mono/diheme cytochrome c family protein
VLLGLSTEHSIGLALTAGLFVVFALVSSLLIPRRWPQFPGDRGLRWFVVITVVLCVATLGAVEVFAKESSEESAQAETQTETSGTTTGATTTSEAPPPAAPEGDPAAGKSVFSAQGCGTCHTFGPAASNGTVGPDLDKALQGKDAGFVHESIVDPNKEIASGYQPNIMPGNFGQSLSPKQVDDLVAFLTQK